MTTFLLQNFVGLLKLTTHVRFTIDRRRVFCFLSSLKVERAFQKTMPGLESQKSSIISNYFLNLYRVKITADIIGFERENQKNKRPKCYHQLPRSVLLKIFRYFTEEELQIKIMPVRERRITV